MFLQASAFAFGVIQFAAHTIDLGFLLLDDLRIIRGGTSKFCELFTSTTNVLLKPICLVLVKIPTYFVSQRQIRQ